MRRKHITVFLPHRQGLSFNPARERRVDVHHVCDDVQVIGLMFGHPGHLGNAQDGEERFYPVRPGYLPGGGADDLVQVVGALTDVSGELGGELKLHPESVGILHRDVEAVVPAPAVSPEAGHFEDLVPLRPEATQSALHGVPVVLLGKRDGEPDPIVGLLQEFGSANTGGGSALLELPRQGLERLDLVGLVHNSRPAFAGRSIQRRRELMKPDEFLVCDAVGLNNRSFEDAALRVGERLEYQLLGSASWSVFGLVGCLLRRGPSR